MKGSGNPCVLCWATPQEHEELRPISLVSPCLQQDPATGSSSWIKHGCRYFFSRAIIMNKFEAEKENTSRVFITIFQEKQPSFDGRCGNIKRSRRLLYLSSQGEHLLTGMLENPEHLLRTSFHPQQRAAQEWVTQERFSPIPTRGFADKKGSIYIFSWLGFFVVAFFFFPCLQKNIHILLGK